MKTIVLELPDDNYNTVVRAFCEHFDYQESITHIKGVQGKPLKEEKQANPQSKEAFVVEKVVDFMMQVVKENTLARKREEARKEADQLVGSIQITHKTDN
jgi:hypothetical protein